MMDFIAQFISWGGCLLMFLIIMTIYKWLIKAEERNKIALAKKAEKEKKFYDRWSKVQFRLPYLFKPLHQVYLNGLLQQRKKDYILFKRYLKFNPYVEPGDIIAVYDSEQVVQFVVNEALYERGIDTTENIRRINIKIYNGEADV